MSISRPLSGNERFLKAKQKHRQQKGRRILQLQKGLAPESTHSHPPSASFSDIFFYPLATFFKTLSSIRLPTAQRQLLIHFMLMIVLINMPVSLASTIRSTNKPTPGKKKNNGGQAIISDTHSKVFKATKQTCQNTDELVTTNKIHTIAMGVSQGMLYHYSCQVNPQSETCRLDRTAYDSQPNQHPVFDPQIQKARDIMKNEMDKILQKKGMELKQVFAITPMTSTQFAQFEKQTDLVTELHLAHFRQHYARIIGGARCEEMAMTVVDAARTVAQINPEDTIPKLQKVSLAMNNLDHVFLLVDNPMPNINITNKPKKVAKYLKKMGGYICDRWNKGLFVQASKNINGFYNQNAGWHSLEITDITPQFNFEGLPKKAVDFLKQWISEIPLIPKELKTKRLKQTLSSP